MPQDSPLRPFPIPLTGKWKPVIDGTQLAEGDFQTLTNMRYTDAPGIKSVSGMTKINSTALTTYTKIKSGIHFRKEKPAESHVLVQAFNSAETQAKVYENTTAIPNAGNFSATEVFSDTASSEVGQWTTLPDGCVGYCNGQESCLWGGDEYRCVGFFNDTTGNLDYDYTDRVNNTLVDAPNVAILNAAADTKTYIYIAANRPLNGIKFYVQQVNSGASTLTLEYWNGSTFTAASSVVDGTAAVAGTPLAQTGTISFTSTVGLARTKVINGFYFYWYKLTYGTGLTAGTSIYYCTTKAPMQSVVDIWDGAPRPIQFALFTTAYVDYTINVLKRDYVSLDTTTYVSMGGYGAGAYVYLGFVERMTALEIGVVAGNINAATLTLCYWNGAAWTSVTVSDGTVGTNNSFGKSGWISWTPISSSLEFPLSLNNGPSLYYYRLNWSGAFSATVGIDYIFGIPVPRELKAYKFMANWQNRTVLIGEIKGKKNTLLIGSYGAVSSFNGSDSLEREFGDESLPTAAGAIFTRYTGAFYDTLIITKKNECWVMDGLGVQDYRLYKISDVFGCVAPDTFKVFPVAYELVPGISRHVAIWQSATGIVLFDGNTINPIDRDIRNYFDRTKSECISDTLLDKSIAFIDEREREYHWIFASGSAATGLNTELVFNLERKAWFKISRGTVIQCGIPVKSTNGGAYTYGGTSTGYLERLEYGNTFDGTANTWTVKTKDYTPGWSLVATDRYFKLIARAKSTANSTTVSAYLEGSNTADTKSLSLSLLSTSNRIVQHSRSIVWGRATFIAFECTGSSTDQPVPFEPIGMSLLVKDVKEDVNTEA